MKRRDVLIDLGLVAVAALDGVLGLYTTDMLELVLTLVGAAGLLLRRRLPLLSLALALPALFLTGGPIASVIALYTVASAATGMIWLVAATAITFLGLGLSWDTFTSVNDHVLAIVYATMTSGGAVALGRLRRNQSRLSASLDELRRARADENRRVAREAVAEERAHLAREMHDVVSHQVSLITVQAGALMVRADDPEVAETADTIRTLASTTLAELRQMLLVLRADGPEAAPLGPQPTLRHLDEILHPVDLEVDARIDLREGLPPATQRAVYRTIQEGLTNVRKHAPGARVEVTATSTDTGAVHVALRNAVSPEPHPDPAPTARLGHLGLSERAHMLGGSFRAGPLADGGYEIDLRLPAAH
ncbi:sensor histidine kinase [Microbacterium sp. 16-032]|jgi:signal transduction histidine kinase|uniref:sensor histidine kinase n=1 Tax=Microbacterium sp. 16-032 TaxID=3239808 RepID=UPI0034E229CC